MLIDGPIEARGLQGLRRGLDGRLRRCSSTAPLKPPALRASISRPAATPSMLIDGPIEAPPPGAPSECRLTATPSMLIDGPIEAIYFNGAVDEHRRSQSRG